MKKFNEFDDDDENKHSEGEYGYKGDMAMGLTIF
jgi:hypothetical protein